MTRERKKKTMPDQRVKKKKTTRRTAEEKMSAAVALLRSSTTGEAVGMFTFTRVPNRKDVVCVMGAVEGIGAGKHGLHIHEFGDSTNGCVSAGEHYDPHRSGHHGGVEGPHRHAGDLGNVEPPTYGPVHVHGLSVESIVGRSLVLHAGEDDLGLVGDAESLRTGNSGPRIACAVIGWAQEDKTGTPK